MKQTKLISALLIAAPLLASSALAATPGFYAGAQAGIGRANDDDLKNLINQSFHEYYNELSQRPGTTSGSFNSNEGGFAGRLFVGYNFNRYFGIEGGYTDVANNKYDYNVTHTFIGTDSYQFNVKTKTSAWDLVGKAYLPLEDMGNYLNKVDLYAKLGMANVSHKIEDTEIQSNFPTIGNSDSNRSWRPVYGVGIGYNFDKNLTLDVSWTQIAGKGSINAVNNEQAVRDQLKKYSPQVNTFALGLTYHFG